MQRQLFLAGSAMMAALTEFGIADELRRDLRIARAVGFGVRRQRLTLVGKNARLGVHVDSATHRMVRLYTNAGLEAIGNCRASAEAIAKLVGRNPFDLYQRDEMRMTVLTFCRAT